MMKVLVVILLVLVGVVGYFYLAGEEKTTEPTIASNPVNEKPYWEQPLPEGYKVRTNEPEPRFEVKCVRTNNGQQAKLEFHISEEHGYVVDSILISFWYRKFDEQTQKWVDTSHVIEHFSKARLMPNDTLVEVTTLLPTDFPDLGMPMLDTTTENWGASISSYDTVGVPEIS